MRNLNINEVALVSGGNNEAPLLSILGEPVTLGDAGMALAFGFVAYLSPYGCPADYPLLRATLGTVSALPLIHIFKNGLLKDIAE